MVKIGEKHNNTCVKCSDNVVSLFWIVEDLVALLKWKSQPEKVKQTLLSVLELPGEEIVKFLQDVLDVLFAMFVSEEGSNTEYSEDAFSVLLHIFDLLEDSKFKHFKPVIDAYIFNHFSAALVYK